MAVKAELPLWAVARAEESPNAVATTSSASRIVLKLTFCTPLIMIFTLSTGVSGPQFGAIGSFILQQAS